MQTAAGILGLHLCLPHEWHRLKYLNCHLVPSQGISRSQIKNRAAGSGIIAPGWDFDNTGSGSKLHHRLAPNGSIWWEWMLLIILMSLVMTLGYQWCWGHSPLLTCGSDENQRWQHLKCISCWHLFFSLLCFKSHFHLSLGSLGHSIIVPYPRQAPCKGLWDTFTVVALCSHMLLLNVPPLQHEALEGRDQGKFICFPQQIL